MGLDEQALGKGEPLFEDRLPVMALVLPVAVDHPLLALQDDIQGPDFGSLVRPQRQAESDLLPPSDLGGAQLNGGLSQLSPAQASPDSLQHQQESAGHGNEEEPALHPIEVPAPESPEHDSTQGQDQAKGQPQRAQAPLHGLQLVRLLGSGAQIMPPAFRVRLQENRQSFGDGGVEHGALHPCFQAPDHLQQLSVMREGAPWSRNGKGVGDPLPGPPPALPRKLIRAPTPRCTVALPLGMPEESDAKGAELDVLQRFDLHLSFDLLPASESEPLPFTPVPAPAQPFRETLRKDGNLDWISHGFLILLRRTRTVPPRHECGRPFPVTADQ